MDFKNDQRHWTPAFAGVTADLSLVAVGVQPFDIAARARAQVQADRTTADRAILDVFGIARGAVDRGFESLATERATQGDGVEHGKISGTAQSVAQRRTCQFFWRSAMNRKWHLPSSSCAFFNTYKVSRRLPRLSRILSAKWRGS